MAAIDRTELDDILRQTLDDRRLSRTERRALAEVFADYDLDDDARGFVRSRVFALAREHLRAAGARAVLDWAEDVVKLVQARHDRDPTIGEVHFSPSDECRRRIVRLLASCRGSADICVFTITDDWLARAILDAHARGVAVRIITDDEKVGDPGSDVYRIARAGVPVRCDDSEAHMHHKFALFDRRIVLTGSYNWTRSAAKHNRENFLITDDSQLVEPYVRAFDALWQDMSPITVPPA
ncbi:MAG: endonuclease [Deltaproteobacteria bacterium]|nr:MAG: endonuclease [Deltaproteobacteria bacterium]